MTRGPYDPKFNPIDRAIERDARARGRRIGREAGGISSSPGYTPTAGPTSGGGGSRTSRLLDMSRDQLLGELSAIEYRLGLASGHDRASQRERVRDEVDRNLILDIIEMRGW